MLTAKCHRLTTLALERQYKTTRRTATHAHTQTHLKSQHTKIQAPRGGRHRQWEAGKGTRKMPNFKYSSLPWAASPSVYLCHRATAVMGGDGNVERMGERGENMKTCQ